MSRPLRAEQRAQLGIPTRPHDSRDFLPIAQQHDARPQLDAERATQALALAVLDRDVTDLGVLRERAIDQRARSLAVPAPRGAELERDQTRHRIDVFTRELAHDTRRSASVRVLASGS